MFKCEDDMVECPYNKSHLMLRKRLQSHLLKCRRHYPDVELRKCPFNATHLVPEPEFMHHVTNCPDRKLITQYKYDAPELKEEEEEPKHAPVESEENWDDTDVPDYDPTKYIEKATVIRMPDGPTPSERKEFIKKERQRLGDPVSEDEDVNDLDDDIVVQDVPVVQENRPGNHSNRDRSRSPILRSHYDRSNPSSGELYEKRYDLNRATSERDRYSYNTNGDGRFSRDHFGNSRLERYDGERERNKYLRSEQSSKDKYSKAYARHSEPKNSSPDYRSFKPSYNNRRF